MASPVDTSVKNFNSTMALAPILNGLPGSNIAILDACLVTGFDTKTLSSLVVVSGIATATFSGTHSAQLDSVILITGVTGELADLNGEQKVVVAGGLTTVKFLTALADGTAAGTITMKMAPVGWAKVFSGTNLAVYQSLDPTSSKMFLRIDDTADVHSRVVGYESMTDVNTGTNPFPTPVQVSGGGYWPKSSLANTVANHWALFADKKLFHVARMPGLAATPSAHVMVTFFFGDLAALKVGGDLYCCGLNFSRNASVNNMCDGGVFAGQENQTSTPRAFTGLGRATLGRIVPLTGAISSTSGMDTTYGTFPSPIDGTASLSKLLLVTATTEPPRATIPGAFSIPHSQVLETYRFLDRIPVSGSLGGRALQGIPATQYYLSYPSSSVYSGIGFFDITGPWR